MKKKLMYTSIILFILTIVSKLLAYGKESLLAYFYGASSLTDTYIMSQNITYFIFSAFTSSLTIGYITSVSGDNNKSEILNTLLYYVNIVFIVFIVLLMIFTEQVVSFMAPGFGSNEIAQTSYMVRVILPFCFFQSFQYLIGAELQSENIFWHIGVCGVISNIIMIIFIAISNHNLFVLSLGYGLSILCHALFVFILARKKGYKYSVKKSSQAILKMKKIISIAYPIFFIEIFTNAMSIIDKAFASNVGEGVISSVNYANRVITLIVTFFVSIISTVLLPSLVKKAEEKTYDNYKSAVQQIFVYVLFIILPIAVISIFCSKEIVEILFMRGAFDSDMASLTASLLFIYSIGVPSLAMNSILKNQLYSLKESKKSAIFTIICIIINIILDSVLIKIYSYKGLAIASVISSYLLLAMMIYFLIKKVGHFKGKYLISNISKLFIAIIFMVISIFIFKKYVSISSNIIGLGTSSLVGIGIYIIVLKIFNFEELDYILKTFLKRRKK